MIVKYIPVEKSQKVHWVGLYPHPGGKNFPTPQGNLIGQKRDLGPWVNTSEKMSTGKHVEVVFFSSLAYPNMSLFFCLWIINEDERKNCFQNAKMKQL